MYLRPIIYLAAILVIGATAGASRAQTVAVIVHPDNPVETLSAAELKKIFKAERQIWTSAEQIQLAKVRGDEETKFSELVLDFSAKQFRKYWVKKVFRGEAKPIRSFKTGPEILAFVAENPLAIGFINAAELDDSVKAVRVNGKAYGDAGYILK